MLVLLGTCGSQSPHDGPLWPVPNVEPNDDRNCGQYLGRQPLLPDIVVFFRMQ